jgi:NAD(P)-dependent dehydrogenase (short-subunit alcohol dehydrogenase family)
MNRSDITWFTATEPVHMDVMVTSAFSLAASAGIHVSAITPGYANTLAENHKRNKYAPFPIIPITFEAHGRFGDSTLNFLLKLTNTLPEHERAAAYHHSIQLLSTTLQCCNAKTIAAHIAHHTDNHHAAASAAA